MPTAVSNIRSSGGKVSVGGVGGFLRRLKRRSTKKNQAKTEWMSVWNSKVSSMGIRPFVIVQSV